MFMDKEEYEDLQRAIGIMRVEHYWQQCKMGVGNYSRFPLFSEELKDNE